ncbi:MAG: response regulator [Bacteroidetes bacterium]|nr:response regulator [Bacteroidota bacterium]
MNILVIDDEPAIRDVIFEFLTMMDHSVTVAEDGEAGLNEFKHSLFDLVITDLMMPKLNGLEMVARMRALKEGQRVILLSGSDLDGMNFPTNRTTKQLSKPFSFDRLMETIQSFDKDPAGTSKP